MAFTPKNKPQKKKEIVFDTLTGTDPKGNTWTLSKDEKTPRITLRREGELIVSCVTSLTGLGFAKEHKVTWEEPEKKE